MPPEFLVVKLVSGNQYFAGLFTDLEDAKASVIKAYRLAGQTVTFSNQGTVQTYCSVANGDVLLIRQIQAQRQIGQLEGIQN